MGRRIVIGLGVGLRLPKQLQPLLYGREVGLIGKGKKWSGQERARQSETRKLLPVKRPGAGGHKSADSLPSLSARPELTGFGPPPCQDIIPFNSESLSRSNCTIRLCTEREREKQREKVRKE